MAAGRICCQLFLQVKQIIIRSFHLHPIYSYPMANEQDKTTDRQWRVKVVRECTTPITGRMYNTVVSCTIIIILSSCSVVVGRSSVPNRRRWRREFRNWIVPAGLLDLSASLVVGREWQGLQNRIGWGGWIVDRVKGDGESPSECKQDS